MSERIERLRGQIDIVLESCRESGARRSGYIHLYGVSGVCVLLAKRRGLDAEIASTIGMLHDIATCQTGVATDHARIGAREARRMLGENGGFSPGEIDTICTAIEGHSNKGAKGGPYDELIRDADVLQCHLNRPWGSEQGDRAKRLARVLALIAPG